jgi:hypothetical protein
MQPNSLNFFFRAWQIIGGAQATGLRRRSPNRCQCPLCSRASSAMSASAWFASQRIPLPWSRAVVVLHIDNVSIFGTFFLLPRDRWHFSGPLFLGSR